MNENEYWEERIKYEWKREKTRRNMNEWMKKETGKKE